MLDWINNSSIQIWEWLNARAYELPGNAILFIFPIFCLVVWFAGFNPYRKWLSRRYDYKLFNWTWILYVLAMALYYWFAHLFVGKVPDTGLWALITPEADPNTVSSFIKTAWFAFPALVLFFVHSFVKTKNIIVSLISFGVMWLLSVPLAYVASAGLGVIILAGVVMAVFGASFSQTQTAGNTCLRCGKRIHSGTLCKSCWNAQREL